MHIVVVNPLVALAGLVFVAIPSITLWESKPSTNVKIGSWVVIGFGALLLAMSIATSP